MKFEKFASLVANVSKIYEPKIIELIQDGNGVVVRMRFDNAGDEWAREINTVPGIRVGSPGEYGIDWEVKVTGVKISSYGFGTKCLETEDGNKYYDTLDIARGAK